MRRTRLGRRSLLAGVAGVSCGLAGCVGSIGVDSPTPTDRTVPDRPDEFAPDELAAYVADYEAARVHNRHVEDGATEVSVDAVATYEYRADEGHHLTVQHAGTVSYDDDEVGEFRSGLVPYRVTDDATRRVRVVRERVIASPRDQGDEEATDVDSVDWPLGVRLPNFTDRPRELTVSTIADAGSGERVAETTVEVEPGTATELHSIATTPGTYRIIARFEENGVTGEARVDVEIPGTDRETHVDVLWTPDGLSARPLPSFEYI